MENKYSWIKLVPGNLPELRFYIDSEDVDFLAEFKNYDFSPFKEVTQKDSSRTDFDFTKHRYFINQFYFDKYAAGKNIFASFIAITLSSKEIEFVLYGDADNFKDEVNKTNGIIQYLMISKTPFSWRSFSYYYDSGETSEVRNGTSADFNLSQGNF